MTTICDRLRAVLEDNRIIHEVMHHRPDYTAQETAEDTHTPGRDFAKVVVVNADGSPSMLILPADHQIDFAKLRQSLDAESVRLATEDEMRATFTDCDTGAEPPFGNLYGMPVFVSTAFQPDQHITFNAGNHEDVIRMSYRDYDRLVGPKRLDFSTPRQG